MQRHSISKVATKLQQLLWLTCLAALLACSSSTDTADHGIYGGWSGQTTRSGTRYSLGGVTWPENIASTAWNWNIRQCDSGAMIEVAMGCWLPVSGTATDALSFTPGAWCQSTSQGKSTRILAKGGYVGLKVIKDTPTLQGELVSEVEKVPTDGTYNLQNWTIGATKFLGTEKLACLPAHTEPVPVDDYAALAKCAQILDRHYLANDRTVALTADGFDPQCLQIAVGQDVTFTGDFLKYGLRPGIFDNLAAGAAANPLGMVLSGTSKTVTYPRVGDYLFHSPTGTHPAGMIRVR